MIPEPSMLFPPTQGTDMRQVSSTVGERASLIDKLFKSLQPRYRRSSLPR